MCTRLVRPGGHVANVGVHGGPASLHLEDLWTRNVTITTGLVDTWSTPTLLKLLRPGQLDAAKFTTHHFALPDILDAYDVFSRAADTGALKVVLTKSGRCHRWCKRARRTRFDAVSPHSGGWAGYPCG